MQKSILKLISDSQRQVDHILAFSLLPEIEARMTFAVIVTDSTLHEHLRYKIPARFSWIVKESQRNLFRHLIRWLKNPLLRLRARKPKHTKSASKQISCRQGFYLKGSRILIFDTHSSSR